MHRLQNSIVEFFIVHELQMTKICRILLKLFTSAFKLEIHLPGLYRQEECWEMARQSKSGSVMIQKGTY
jgi:hypothetical protein